MHLRPLTRDDLTYTASISNVAFRDDPLHTMFFPPKAVESGSLRRNSMRRIRKRLVEKGTHCFVSESDEKDEFWSGQPEILGYVFWVRVGKSAAARKWQADTLFMKLERRLIGAEMWYAETFEDRHRPWDKINYVRNLTMDNFASIPEYLELAALAVDPKFHRRGIGGMMLQWGIDAAKKEQVPVVLEATPAGTQLYRRFGFQETGRTELFPDVAVVAMKLEPTA